MSSKMDHKELQRRLKEDEMQVYIQELVDNGRKFLDEYGAKIGFGFLAILGVLIAAYVYQSRQDTNFMLSQTYFANAMALLQMDEQSLDQAIVELDKLILEFPDAKVTQLAYLQRGNAHFNNGDFQFALDDYQIAAEKLPPQERIAAKLGIIQAQRSLGSAQAAIDTITDLEPSLESEAMKNKVAYLKAGAYHDLGDEANALETYRSIDPDSSWYSFAQDQIRWLEASAAVAIN